MATKMLTTAFKAFATRGASYTADVNGVIAAVAAGDVVDMINMGATVAPDQIMSTALTQFGGAQPQAVFGGFGEEGNLYRNIANPIAGNAADTTDDILDGFVLPAGAFDQARRGLMLTIQGKFGATANNKRIKVWANPTMSGQTVTAGVISGGTVTGVGSGALLLDSAVQTGNNVGFSMFGNWFKYGAAGSNTQYFQSSPIFGAAHGGISLPAFTTIPENAAINIVITGSSPTTGAVNDVVLNFTEANAMN